MYCLKNIYVATRLVILNGNAINSKAIYLDAIYVVGDKKLSIMCTFHTFVVKEALSSED